MKVGLFDSGIGGLTVLKTLRKKYPNNDYIYLGDTINMPYGSKSIAELKELSKNNVEFLKKHNVDKIIIACGTVSSNCLEFLKEKYNIPIEDIISPTINYLNTSEYKRIGVIATERTVSSHIFKKNINKEVYEIAAPKLVPLIENNELDDIENILYEYLKDYLDKIDILVLGCTHYPIIKDNILKIIPHNIKILDMSELIDIDNLGSSTTKLYFTKLDDTITNNIKKIINSNIKIK